jgi:hypothetical protein
MGEKDRGHPGVGEEARERGVRTRAWGVGEEREEGEEGEER